MTGSTEPIVAFAETGQWSRSNGGKIRGVRSMRLSSLLMPTTARRSVFGATVLALFLAAGTGCSSGSGRADSDSEVLEALGALAEDSSASAIAYLDAAKARELGKGYERGLGSVGLPGGPLSGTRPGLGATP
ncbi:hypothetical protein L1856_08950 [Streptomyces sp. Tue 6430]|nr:hypothetical protein [Streptomyces sp. Tue 6430]